MATYRYGPNEKNLVQITAGDTLELLVWAFDSTTPTTPKTGLAFGSVTVTVCKPAGTSFAAWPASPGWGTGNWAEVGNGCYRLIFTGSVAAELALLDTVGPILFHLSASGAIFPEVCRTIVAAGVLRPTAAGRTLDVSATGEAGVDWANVGSPTTAVGLSGTTVGTAETIGATGLAAIWNRLTSALTTVGSIGKLIVDYLDAAITSRHASGAAVASVAGAVGSVTGAVGSVTGAVGSVTGNVGGSAASVTGAVGSVAATVALNAAERTAIGNAVLAIDEAAGAVDYEAIMATGTTVGAFLAACRAALVGKMTAPSATAKRYYDAAGTAHYIAQTHGADYTTRETPTQG